MFNPIFLDDNFLEDEGNDQWPQRSRRSKKDKKKSKKHKSKRSKRHEADSETELRSERSRHSSKRKSKKSKRSRRSSRQEETSPGDTSEPLHGVSDAIEQTEQAVKHRRKSKPPPAPKNPPASAPKQRCKDDIIIVEPGKLNEVFGDQIVAEKVQLMVQEAKLISSMVNMKQTLQQFEKKFDEQLKPEEEKLKDKLEKESFQVNPMVSFVAGTKMKQDDHKLLPKPKPEPEIKPLNSYPLVKVSNPCLSLEEAIRKLENNSASAVCENTKFVQILHRLSKSLKQTFRKSFKSKNKIQY